MGGVRGGVMGARFERGVTRMRQVPWYIILNTAVSLRPHQRSCAR